MSLLARDRPTALSIELDVLARAAGGAMLFGMPLMFTIEMWWLGELNTPLQVLPFLAAAFAMNVALARLSGFRRGVRSLAGDAAEAVEAMAVGAVLSALCLLALGRIGGEAPLGATIGTICMQILPLSLGASVANLLFTDSAGRVHASSDTAGARSSPRRELLDDVAATIAGAVFVAFAIAPTEEIPMLAADLDGRHMFGIIALGMVASYVIVFASGFDPSHHTPHRGGLFQGPVSETVLSFTVSLAVVAVVLLAFGQIALDDPLHATLGRIIALAIPASIGGAAGRVVV